MSQIIIFVIPSLLSGMYFSCMFSLWSKWSTFVCSSCVFDLSSHWVQRFILPIVKAWLLLLSKLFPWLSVASNHLFNPVMIYCICLVVLNLQFHCSILSLLQPLVVNDIRILQCQNGRSICSTFNKRSYILGFSSFVIQQSWNILLH